MGTDLLPKSSVTCEGVQTGRSILDLSDPKKNKNKNWMSWLYLCSFRHLFVCYLMCYYSVLIHFMLKIQLLLVFKIWLVPNNW